MDWSRWFCSASAASFTSRIASPAPFCDSSFRFLGRRQSIIFDADA